MTASLRALHIPVSFERNSTKLRLIWVSLFSHSLQNLNSTTWLEFVTSAELFKPVAVLPENVFTNGTNGIDKSDHSSFHSTQSTDARESLWQTQFSNVLKKLLSIAWKTLSFSTSQSRMLSSLEHIILCLFSTSPTFFRYKIFSHILPLSSIRTICSKNCLFQVFYRNVLEAAYRTISRSLNFLELFPCRDYRSEAAWWIS